jgi:hypothetical protein
MRVLPVAVVLALAPPAAAKVYCVTPASGCADGSFATVQAALDQAKGNAGPDEVHLGAMSYTSGGGFTYSDNGSAANTVDISGAGRTATTLTRSANGPILLLSGNARNTVRDLRFHITGTTSSFGLQGGSADVMHVDVDADAGVTGSEGLQTQPGTVRDVHVTMPAGGGNYGVVGGGPAATDGLFDSTVVADWAVYVNGSVQHSHLTGRNAAILMQTGTVDDVVARLTGSAPLRVGLSSQASAVGGSTSMAARHLTILGDGQPGSVGISVDGNSILFSGSQTVDVKNTIVRGVVKSFQRSGTSNMGNTGTANLTIHYSDFDPATAEQSGPGTGPDLNNDATNVNVDPLFVDPATGDLHLRYASPVIDAGDPAALAAGEPTTDFGGDPRVVDGNGDGTARRDMGALEYQRRAPQITSATATPTTAEAGVPFAFAASATDPEGEDLTYAWSFDDGSASPGANVDHAFATAGSHQATVTVTDSAGASATAQVPVTVTAPPQVLPILSSLVLNPSKFRVGRNGGSEASFTLNVAAEVRFRVDRTTAGRKVKGVCRAATRRNRHARKCTRHRRVRGSFKRAGVAGANRFHFTGRLKGKALKPGSYRLIGRAANSVRRAKFAIKRR